MRWRKDPDSISLEEVLRMDSKQWRMFVFLRLGSVDSKLIRIERRVGRVEYWIVLVLATVLGSLVGVALA